MHREDSYIMKFLNHIFKRHAPIALSILFVLAFAVMMKVFATGGPNYDPGETLDPGFGPGTAVVDIPTADWTTVSNDMHNTNSGNVLITSGKSFKGTTGTAALSFNDFSSNDVTLSADGTAYQKGWFYADNGQAQIGFDFNGGGDTSLITVDPSVVRIVGAGDSGIILSLDDTISNIDTTVTAPNGVLAVAKNGVLIKNATTAFVDGNVGIGTTSPADILEVGDGTGQKNVVINGGNSTNDGASIRLKAAGGDALTIGHYSGIFGGTYDKTFTLDGGNMLLGPSGYNVGIGHNATFTSWAPARPLHIRDVMRLEPIDTAPLSASDGDIYFDADNDDICIRGAGAWHDTTGAVCS